MQDSHITNLKKAVGNGTISIAIKILLLVCLLIYISVELFQSQDLAQQFNAMWSVLYTQGWSGIYLILVLLVPVNWLLEACKWQFLLKPVTRISLGAAIKGVLTGLSLGFMTPHSLGDYLGRIGHLRTKNRLESLGAILLGRGAQFLATLLFGLLGLWAWYQADSTGWALWVFLGTLASLAILLSLFIYSRKRFVEVCKKIWPAASKFVRVLSRYSTVEVFIVFGLSALRYMVFATQFFLLLYWLNVPLPLLTLWAGVTWVFLAKSVIPAFNFLSDLGVREFSALYFFGLYAIAPAPILTASLSIWFLNILLPTLIGSSFIMQMKITKT